jgi:hypothetical protein
MIITLENGPSEDIPIQQIDGVKIYTVKNVTSYEYQQSKHSIQYNNTTQSSDNKYFLFESTSNEAFSHWIIESAILISIYKKLKLIYPTLKLHLLTTKQYKTLFLNHFNISKDDITYSLEQSNECFLAEPFTNFHNKENCNLHYQYIVQFFNTIRPETLPEKDIDILLLPRQTKENYAPNDRTHNTKAIEDIISKTINCHVLHTDIVTDIKDQINLVLRAKNIIVTDGSPYSINGLISLNSNIICIGNVMRSQIVAFSEVRMLDTIIRSHNTVHNIERNTRTYTFQDIRHFLR